MITQFIFIIYGHLQLKFQFYKIIII